VLVLRAGLRLHSAPQLVEFFLVLRKLGKFLYVMYDDR